MPATELNAVPLDDFHNSRAAGAVTVARLVEVVVAVGKTSPEASASIGRREHRCSRQPKAGYHWDLTFKMGPLSSTSSHRPWNSD